MAATTAVERILVQLADREWTLDATHRACQIARMTSAEIIFIKMVSVQHVGWLGTELGYLDFTPEDYSNLQDYASTAEDYGVACSIQRYQYITYVEGLSNVAAYFGTQLVFATPVNALGVIRQLQYWLLRRALSHQNQQLADTGVVASLLSMDSREPQTRLQDVNISV